MSELKQRRQQNPAGAAAETASNGTASQEQHPHLHPPKTLQHQAQEVAAHLKQEMNGKSTESPKTPVWVYLLLVLFAAITYVTIPVPFHPPHGKEPTIQHVFYYGWLTAISTGLGALPFWLVPDVQSYWVGVSNGTLVVVSFFFCEPLIACSCWHVLVQLCALLIVSTILFVSL